MEGLIRKIVVGRDPKNGMAYYVGMRAGSGEVSAIVEDERHPLLCRNVLPRQKDGGDD